VRDKLVGGLPYGTQKQVELGRALALEPELLLLDEPSAGVNPILTQILIDRIEELNRRGITFLIIEHDMDFIMRHCNPILAMAQGKLVFEGTAQQAQENPVLLDAYLGASADA